MLLKWKTKVPQEIISVLHVFLVLHQTTAVILLEEWMVVRVQWRSSRYYFLPVLNQIQLDLCSLLNVTWVEYTDVFFYNVIILLVQVPTHESEESLWFFYHLGDLSHSTTTCKSIPSNAVNTFLVCLQSLPYCHFRFVSLQCILKTLNFIYEMETNPAV